MQSYKTTGLVLKSTKLGEADKIVTFLTARGKVSAVAKGVRRTASKFGGRLEPGNDLDLVFAKGRSLDVVTQTHVQKARPWIRENLEKLDAAYGLLEMADKLAVEGSGDNRQLALLAAALDRLKDDPRVELVLLAYDIKALAIAGFLPSLAACVHCQRPISSGRLWPAEGGMICERCYSGGEAVRLGETALDLIKRLLRGRFVDLDLVQVPDRVLKVAKVAIWAHITFYIHSDFKTRAGTHGREAG